MIIRDFYATREDGVSLYITKSDRGVMILKIGTDEVYDQAIDVETAPYTYEETFELIEVLKEEATEPTE